MSSNIEDRPLRIEFEKIAAKPLEKSKGKKKNRIQILGADNPNTQATYAIAAQAGLLKKIPEGRLERLSNWLNRVVLLKVEDEKGNVGFVKVNKLSLKKRLGLQGKEIRKFETEAAKGPEALTKFVNEKIKEHISTQAREISSKIPKNQSYQEYRALITAYELQIENNKLFQNRDILEGLLISINDSTLKQDLKDKLLVKVHYHLSKLALTKEDKLIHQEHAAKLGNIECLQSVAQHFKKLFKASPFTINEENTNYTKAIEYYKLLEKNEDPEASKTLGDLYKLKAQNSLGGKETIYRKAATQYLEAIAKGDHSALSNLLEMYKEVKPREALNEKPALMKKIKDAAIKCLKFYKTATKKGDNQKILEFGRLYIDSHSQPHSSEILKFSYGDARLIIRELIKLEENLSESRKHRKVAETLLDEYAEILEEDGRDLPFTKDEFDKWRKKP